MPQPPDLEARASGPAPDTLEPDDPGQEASQEALESGEPVEAEDGLELDLDDSEDTDDTERSGEHDESDPSAALVPASEPGGGRAVERADPLTAYMAELRHHAPISREEEHQLARRWVEEGDVSAARRLVLANLRLVVKIAMEYRRAWTNTLDLIQEGNVGLMEAVQRYDPYQGVKLSSYAVYWIRAYILKYILDHMRSVRLGTTRAQRKLFFRLNKERRELERQGYEVTPRLIAERLEVPEEDVLRMQASLSSPDLSMDAPVRQEEPGATRGDFFEAVGESAEEQVGSGELHRVFREEVSRFAEGLDEREKKILHERLLADEPRTLAEMGEEFGVSRERVRQIEARMVKRLREHLKAHLVDFEVYARDED